MIKVLFILDTGTTIHSSRADYIDLDSLMADLNYKKVDINPNDYEFFVDDKGMRECLEEHISIDAGEMIFVFTRPNPQYWDCSYYQRPDLVPDKYKKYLE